MTDFNPAFATGMLATLLAEIDAEDNGYDHAVGPCGNKKKWVVGGDTQMFVAVDDLPSNYRDANDLFDDEEDLEGTWDETCFAMGPTKDLRDRYTAMAYRRRCNRVDYDGIVTMMGISPDNRPEVIEELAEKFDRETLDRWDREAEDYYFALEFFGTIDAIDDFDVLQEESLPSTEGSRSTAVRNFGGRIYNNPDRGMSHGKYNRKREPKSERHRTFIAA